MNNNFPSWTVGISRFGALPAECVRTVRLLVVNGQRDGVRCGVTHEKGGMLRIVVLATAATSRGALTVLQSLHRHVVESQQTHEWIFITSHDAVASTPTVRTRILSAPKRSWIHRLVFEFLQAARQVNALHPDVVFSLQNTLPFGLRGRSAVYVHQPIPFQSHRSFSLRKRGERRLAIYQHAMGPFIRCSIARADLTIVQTRWMKNAIIAPARVSPDRVKVVSPSLSDLGVASSCLPFRPVRFIYPTSQLVYKNNECIYAACSILASGGITDFSVIMTLEGLPPSPQVEFVGHISREDVLNVLRDSTLIFPSYIETYGLPLAEARALGSLVLVAECEYAREVMDGYPRAHFFDPSRPDELATLMEGVIRGRLRRGGPLPCTSQTRGGWQEAIELLERLGEGRAKPSGATSPSVGHGGPTTALKPRARRFRRVMETRR